MASQRRLRCQEGRPNPLCNTWTWRRGPARLVRRVSILIWWLWQLASISTSSCTPLQTGRGRTRCRTSWAPLRELTGEVPGPYRPYWNERQVVPPGYVPSTAGLASSWQPWPSKWVEACRLRRSAGRAWTTQCSQGFNQSRWANQLAAVHVDSIPFSLASKAGSVGISAWLVSALVYCRRGLGQGV